MTDQRRKGRQNTIIKIALICGSLIASLQGAAAVARQDAAVNTAVSQPTVTQSEQQIEQPSVSVPALQPISPVTRSRSSR